MISRAIGFPFRGPHVWANLGCVVLCTIIPAVGPLVVGGYLIVVEKRLIENIDSDAPRFKFDRFVDYLIKGVWPFVLGLILSCFILPLVMCLWFGMFIGVTMLHDRPAVLVGVMITAAIVLMTLSLALAPLVQPLVLKVSLQGDLKGALDWRFALDYFKRVGLLSIGQHVLLVLIIFPVSILSFCIPYLGLFAVVAISNFVQIHLNTQIYLEYLNRGGMPIPFEPEPPEPAFPVVQSPPDPLTSYPPESSPPPPAP